MRSGLLAAPDYDRLPEFAAIQASFNLDGYREKATEPAMKATGPIRVAMFDC